ncbi:MAG TPA: pre-peptidase C-terminal domain-containing protein, partial [Phototrophicaceae bacterium]|nr:pre-peptidase C-terminal domain-containing protein [Phototrophicaceae bacterium]
SLAVSPDGQLYVTDQPETGIQVRVLTGETERQIVFDETVLAQPWLAIDPAGRLLALISDGRLLVLEGEAFMLLHEFNLPGAVINGFVVTRHGDYLIATENQGVLIVNTAGEVRGQLGRVVLNSPLPGEFVAPRGVTVDGNGTVYVVDSDGTFGAVTAMSSRVETGRVGSSALLPGAAVRGTLNAQTVQQEWTLDGRAGQWLTISAVDDNGGLLDVALRLIGPDGQEVAFNDDQAGTDLPNATDAQLADYLLAQDGVYTVRVEQVNGSGSYRLGISQEQVFDLSAAAVTRLSGTLQAVLPVERWTFTGQAGQVLTFTMQASGGTLDSVLRLLDADGNVLTENDDAADTALGKDAQLVQVALPADGTYTLEARRFDGDGGYTLVIVATS